MASFIFSSLILSIQSVIKKEIKHLLQQNLTEIKLQSTFRLYSLHMCHHTPHLIKGLQYSIEEKQRANLDSFEACSPFLDSTAIKLSAINHTKDPLAAAATTASTQQHLSCQVGEPRINHAQSPSASSIGHR